MFNGFNVKARIGNFRLLRKCDGGFFEVCGIPLKKGCLLRLMKRAQRGGALYRFLKASEYMFVKLVAKMTQEVRSFILAKALAPIIMKLLEALQATGWLMTHVLGEVEYWMREAGRALAEKVSRIAQLWGNKSAHTWARDESFIRYLTVMNLSELKKRQTVEA